MKTGELWSDLREAYLTRQHWPHQDRVSSPERGALEWGAIRFAALTGARYAEQLALTTDSFTKAGVVLRGPRVARLVPLNYEAFAICMAWSTSTSEPEGLLFWPWLERGKLFAEDSPATTLRTMAAEVGLSLSWQDLRHLFAGELLPAADLRTVQHLLGHARPGRN